MRKIFGVAAALAVGAVFGACGFFGGGGQSQPPNPYAGSWSFHASPVSTPVTPGCMAEWGPFTVPILVDKAGNFSVEAATGTVGSDGSVIFNAPTPANLPCGGGMGRGSCDSMGHCSGNFNVKDGSRSSWAMSRPLPQ